MISKKDVQYIAKLARLGLTESEEKKFQGELFLILKYIEKLKEADVSKVKAVSYTLAVENVFRKDEARKLEINKANKLIALAPEKKRGYVKVKAVLWQFLIPNF